MNPTAAWGSSASGLGVYSFASDSTTRIPFYIRTGQQALGDPMERKRFKHVEVHADNYRSGSLAIRIWIDGVYVCDGILSPIETPTANRKINLPRGKNTGYVIDVEMAGDADLRGLEFHFSPMNATS